MKQAIEIFDKDCPYYMAIGMTYEEYWNDHPLMVRAFYKADKLRRKRADEDAWLNGLYMMRALDATVGNMFREKGSNPATYPEEPFSYGNDREKRESEKAKEKREEDEALWAEAWMSQMVQAGKNWGK